MVNKRKTDVEVTVLCTAYNQEVYIKTCLDGFVSQKASFKFIVYVHDDCSTDRTAEIIAEYAKKYPDIIKPLYEKKNQYSAGVNLYEDILYPLVKSKYVAYCEGDDYWCDVNKLQKQYDEMEKNPKLSMCVHNTKFFDISQNRETGLFNNFQRKKVMSPIEIINGWNVQTSSYFIRSKYCKLKDFCKGFWCTDYPLLLCSLLEGDILCLPDAMSVYRANNPAGSVAESRGNQELAIWRHNQRIELLHKFDEASNYKYKKETSIDRGNRMYLAMRIDFRSRDCSRKYFRAKSNELKNSEDFKNYIKTVSTKERIMINLQLNFFMVNKLLGLRKKT